MKHKQIMSFFALALPISIIIRLFQIMNGIEMSTGFFQSEYKTQGYLMMGIILVLSLLTAVFALNSHRSPEHPPKPNIFLALASMCFAMALLYEIFIETTSSTVLFWQSALLKITGVLTIIYFVIFALRGYIDIKIPKLCAVIPVIYFIVRIICSFISISGLALISDNIFLIAAYCMCLLFMLQFAKLYNGVDSEYNFRKLLSSGLVCIILCFTQSIPYIIMNIITDGEYVHTSMESSISILFTGIFILVFIINHFSVKNCDS